MKRSDVLLVTWLIAGVDVAASAQSSLHKFTGPLNNSLFGDALGAAGDVDGDGLPDIIIGARYHNVLGMLDVGSAWVYRGGDWSLLHSFTGDSADDTFGTSVSGAGDVNGDGFADLVVGAPTDGVSASPPFSGSARIFSGLDGALLQLVYGPSSSSTGFSVDAAGDVNADGFADYVVGSPRATYAAIEKCGAARILSGLDGSVIHLSAGTAKDDALGHAVIGALDLNADGYDDIVAGAPMFGPGAGYARAFSGQDGSTLFVLSGQQSNELFGEEVAAAGDVNADGYHDIIIGQRYATTANGYESGAALVFAGGSGHLLVTLAGPTVFDDFGRAVDGAGDVDGDGHDDVFVSNTGAGAHVTVYSGADWTEIWKVNGPATYGFGESLAGVGDADGNGFPDLLIGGPQGGQSLPGFARLYAGCDGTVVPYGAGCSGGLEVPTIDVNGCPAPGGLVQITLAGGPAGGVGFLAVGTTQVEIPLGFGCTFLIGGALISAPLPLSSAGSTTSTVTIPASLLSGIGYLQGFVSDHTVAAGFRTTSGVEVGWD